MAIDQTLNSSRVVVMTSARRSRTCRRIRPRQAHNLGVLVGDDAKDAVLVHQFTVRFVIADDDPRGIEAGIGNQLTQAFGRRPRALCWSEIADAAMDPAISCPR